MDTIQKKTIKARLFKISPRVSFQGHRRSLCIKPCGYDTEKNIKTRLFNICHMVPEGKISHISTFGNCGLHFKVAGGHYV